MSAGEQPSLTSTATDLRAAPFERVWYGHLSKTAAGRVVRGRRSLGDPTRNGESEPMLWLLGRHATLLCSMSRRTLLAPPGHAGGSSLGRGACRRCMPWASESGAQVQNTDAPDRHGAPDPPVGPDRFCFLGPLGTVRRLQASRGTRACRPRCPETQAGRRSTGKGTVVGGYLLQLRHRPEAAVPEAAPTRRARRIASGRASAFRSIGLRAVEQLTFVNPDPSTASRASGRLAANPYPAGFSYDAVADGPGPPDPGGGLQRLRGGVRRRHRWRRRGRHRDRTGERATRTTRATPRAEGEIKWYTDDFSLQQPRLHGLSRSAGTSSRTSR